MSGVSVPLDSVPVTLATGVGWDEPVDSPLLTVGNDHVKVIFAVGAIVPVVCVRVNCVSVHIAGAVIGVV